MGGLPVQDLKEIGLYGTVPVVFQQGEETKRTMALPGQPLREVAIQAGQFIKYGCGKGECGTCEALVNGQWVRPCSINVPADLLEGQEYVVQVKSVKNKASSSGKFYSVRSFLYGFYNNVLGMAGMVAYKRNAKRNYQERMEYEDMVRQKTLEKKRARAVTQVSTTGQNRELDK
jgi:aerobic-type carbon monoxide dehydrogenase small subunit (CoxS/CutS family)